ncbi:hypothetical protein D3C85_1686940 [compost metagenome]
MKRLDNRQSKSEKESENESNSVKQDSKREKQSADDDEGPEIPKAANKKKRRQKPSV